jgi:hypothetical protein
MGDNVGGCRKVEKGHNNEVTILYTANNVHIVKLNVNCILYCLPMTNLLIKEWY